MLVSFYRSNQPGPLFFTPLIIAVFWIPAFTNPVLVSREYSPLYQIFFDFFYGFPAVVSSIVAFIALAAQAFYFNYLINKHEILNKRSNLPMIAYALLSIAFPEFMVFSPFTFINILLLFILNNIFKLYKNTHSLPLIFNLGTLLSLATLIYFPSIILIVLLMAGILLLRPFVWREGFVGLAGFFCPYFYLILFYYLKDNLNYLQGFFNSNLSVNSNVSLSLSQLQIWIIAVLGVFLFISLFKVQAGFYKNVIRTRRFLLVFMFFLSNSFFFFLFTSIQIRDFLIILIPLSTFIAYYFFSLKRTWIAEGSFLLLIGLIIANHLLTLF